MKNIPSKRCPHFILGFSLIEVIGIVTILALVATVAISGFNSTQSAVTEAKLLSDVTKLNNLVTVYQASGGSLADAVTPQDVIDSLKTVRGVLDAKTTVGPVTGREVDVRLSANMQTTDQAASSAPRVVWNSASNKFTIAHSGAAGVASFTLDDSLLANDYGAETRTATNERYNSADGWVWQNDKAQALAFLNPLNAVVTNAGGYSYVPTDPGGGGGFTVVTQLPPPSITPRGGSFYLSNFVSTVTLTPGLLVAGSGNASYTVIHADGTSTGWAPYTAPITITYGDTVQAKNTTADAALYSDSATVAENYVVIPTLLPAPVITPTGGAYVATSWPAITIAPNGAPVGPYTAISYKITSSAGVSGAWTTYTGPIVTTYGDTVTAKNVSLNTQFYTDSTTVANTYTLTGTTQLPPPIFIDYYDSTGKRFVVITPDSSQMPIPAGVRIYYTVDGTDPGIKSTQDPVKATLYSASTMVAVPTSGTFFTVTARCYPPTADKIHWTTSDLNDYDISTSPGLGYGAVDVDTSHLLYAPNKGTTDAHVHAYDDKYSVTYVNMFAYADPGLKNIQTVVPAGTYFKLIVSNGNLSPGVLLTINKTYNSADSSTYTQAAAYQNIALSSLPVYTTNGVAGSTKLTSLSFNFAGNTVGGVINTVTPAVRADTPGLHGEARNGALTIQAVKCNADGSNAFTTNTTLSAGGVQGVATSGLLWECTVFQHWTGVAYGAAGWYPNF